MKRAWFAALLLTALPLATRAQEPIPRGQLLNPPPKFIPAPGEPKPPLGFGISGYGVRLKYSGPGYTKYRYTYPGYQNGFPPPAMYYYGYPGSGYSYGVGSGVW